ncbi:uncharacterized protein LOC114938529 [Nylanderia fulva]|uniref:uncharacterized protein LOC114938529 n=1 Tax=Nylanderia fulva TaxID=613905 RepID=UPI0010FB947C|nr:uncharacterized protein LOC114938529 [Nylanderia fulva]
MPLDHSPAADVSSAETLRASSNLADYKRRREIVKGSCTRMETFLNNIVALTDNTRAQVEIRQARLESFWEDYCKIQTQIEMIDAEEANDRIEFEDSFYALCAKFRRLLQCDNQSSARRGSTQSSTRVEIEAISHVRLPKINLPTFSGKYEDWFPFQDTFITIIQNNTSLSDVQRFQYLRAALTDKALDIMKPLEISGNNYDLAWSLLKERYDNKRVIIQTHVRAIFELPVITKENAIDLRQLADGASIHIRALTALNYTITSREWHASLQGFELPTFKELITFLSHRSQILEESARKSSISSVRSDSRSQSRSNVGRQALHTTIERGKCNYCAGEHLIYFCKEFLKLPISQRIAEMRSKRMCLNCLRSQNHIATKCPSGSCRTCNLKHNTLLHISKNEREINNAGAPSVPTDSSPVADGRSAVATHSAVERGDTEVLLSTAIVYIYDANSARKTCRALLDSGSQVNFVTTKYVKLLGLKPQSVNFSVSGIYDDTSISNENVDIKLQSRFNSFAAEIECIVAERIIKDKLPLNTIKRETFKLPFGVELADPRFNVSSDVDLLIGADLFWQLLCVEQIQATSGYLILQKTRLGWIVGGRARVGASRPETGLHSFHVSISNLKLYEQIERFWRIEELGDSNHYTKDERASLRHMRLVPAHAVDRESVYLPHHGVFKGIGRNAKLRVVFDTSCKTTSGIFLNDALMIGPTVQQDLISILTRFRTFAYVFTADIVKMYRQILIHESQLHLQRILWRENSNSPVDDLLAGANTLSEAGRIRDEVIALLRRGQFELGKWSSNCRELLQGISDTSAEVSLGDEASSKILEVAWDPSSDGFRFGYNCGAPTGSITKRTILSEIASLRPFGFIIIMPLTVVAKMIMQDTWQARVGWDESLPQDLHQRWRNVKQQLTRLRELRVPRFVGFRADARKSQVHGFCDASERAYGACVYIRTRDSDGYRVELLISKSRIAPIRAVSLPRLELNAALLLSHLIEKIRASVDLSKSEIILWTDSTITIQWISSPSRKWNAFVANRVGEIQRLTRRSSWRHVPSAHNPADILSRGVDLAGLMQSTIWWNGPAFLQLTEEHWPVKLCVDLSGELPEQKRVTAAVISIQQSIVLNLLDKHFNLDRALRIIAYCLRVARSRTIKYQTTFISHHEITVALRVAVRCVQRHAFSREHKQLTEGRNVDGGSRILSLTPFMDEHEIIRVGGRISNAALPYDARHPMLLPKSHRLTTLIIQREHVKNLHSGLQATMHAVRRRFWPLAARSAVRKTIHNCVTCFKCKPAVSQALMADLPAQRVTASRPFTHSGVDYAGPILLKEGKRRNAQLHKAYMSVFVCSRPGPYISKL